MTYEERKKRIQDEYSADLRYILAQCLHPRKGKKLLNLAAQVSSELRRHEMARVTIEEQLALVDEAEKNGAVVPEGMRDAILRSDTEE